MRTPIPLTLEEFYKKVNEKLKGTHLRNENVRFTFWVKLPDEDRQVELTLSSVEFGRIDHENTGVFAFHLETLKDEPAKT